tara:strand:+ start:415 stop:576 length:162 start_codon:yes stop_codon:yes gene_type:complete
MANTRRTTLRREVIKADPEWLKDKRKDVEYEFSNGRKFEGNNDIRGAYNPDLA